jgi:glycosyltransferase involved in cell wall biosynthesis
MPLVFVNLVQTTGTKGGLEIYARELYRAMGGVDSEFTFVGFASKELAAQGAPWFPGEIIDSGISGENRLTWAIAELWTVSKAASQVGADLIHGPAMFGPLKSAMPTVITVHDLSYFTHPHFMKTKALTEPVKWMEKRGVANASRLIASSQATADMIEKYLDVDPETVDVVHLAGKEAKIVGSSQVERNPDLFLAMGQRSPYKSFETVLQAWKLIEPSQRPKLVITGSHGNDPLIKIVEDLDLKESVELKGWIEDSELVELLSTSAALIETTVAAGFGMPALEAMAQGLPVIISDIPVFREVAGKPAEYFEPANPQDLARAVLKVQSSPELRSSMATQGVKWAQTFSWEKCAVETLDSFRKALISN